MRSCVVHMDILTLMLTLYVILCACSFEHDGMQQAREPALSKRAEAVAAAITSPAPPTVLTVRTNTDAEFRDAVNPDTELTDSASSSHTVARAPKQLEESNANLHAVFIHVLGDAVGSLSAIATGLCLCVRWMFAHVTSCRSHCSLRAVRLALLC
jgi:Co/Zn/Cd efflux system component